MGAAGGPASGLAQSRARDRVALRAGAADARGRGGAGGGGAAGGRDGGRRARELRVPAAPRAHVLREGPVRHRRGVRRPLLARRDRAPGRALGAARRDGRGETARRAADRPAAGQPRGGRRARRRTTAGRRPVRPPGTGKSTSAQAVASRLGWPFVELFPSRLALEDGLANGLGRRFEEIAQLDHVLVFIDEVEEVAGARNLAAPVSVGVVNELLKSIVRFRDRDGRLLVCATNTVAALGPAFLRHGRFDYVLPVGPPDHEARTALWASYLARTGAEADTALLADASFHARRHPAGRPDRRPGRLRAHPRHRHPRTPHHRGLPAHHQPHPAHRHHGDGVGVRGPHHPVRTYMRDRIRAYVAQGTGYGRTRGTGRTAVERGPAPLGKPVPAPVPLPSAVGARGSSPPGTGPSPCPRSGRRCR
ncbi:AAA family ATPase [Streptomyces sp. KAI-26]|uniref:AAA family ATPase n=1 Tax=Streptomyces sp. KAI-26 TaxID=1169747 RepID=UPI0035CC7267